MFRARVLGFVLLAGCLHAGIAQTAPPAAAAPAAAPRETEKTVELDELVRLMKAGKSQEALALADAVIGSYEDRYRRNKVRVFSARSPLEATAYLNEVGTAPGKQPEEAGVYGPAWGDAYYLKGYLLIDLRRYDDARKALEAAVALAPRNAAYRTELGQLLLKTKAFDEAAKNFKQAEVDARELAPASVRKREINGALRGQAFVLVEKKDLDGAEKLYKECVKQDPDDRVALAELRYIDQLRAKGKQAQSRH
jgi:tetratricopeptide (TPR) repeat protein